MEEETAMVAPTGRGAEPWSLKTVAIATWLPAERQASTSGKTSFIGLSHFSIGRARLMQRGRGASLASMVAGAVQPGRRVIRPRREVTRSGGQVARLRPGRGDRRVLPGSASYGWAETRRCRAWRRACPA